MGDYYMKRIQKVLPVGTSRVKFPVLLKNEIFTQPEAIMIQGVFENTGKFYIGGSDVEANYTKGALLFPPGLADAMLPFVNEEEIYVISDTDNQTLMITYLADKV